MGILEWIYESSGENLGTYTALAAGAGAVALTALGAGLNAVRGNTKKKLRNRLQEEKERYKGLRTNYFSLRDNLQEEIAKVQDNYEKRIEIRRTMDHVVPFVDTVERALAQQQQYRQQSHESQLTQRDEYVNGIDKELRSGVSPKRLTQAMTNSKSDYNRALAQARINAEMLQPLGELMQPSEELAKLNEIINEFETLEGRPYRSQQGPSSP